jgi:hypothetical protein
MDSDVDICENALCLSEMNIVGLGIDFYPLGVLKFTSDNDEGDFIVATFKGHLRGGRSHTHTKQAEYSEEGLNSGLLTPSPSVFY